MNLKALFNINFFKENIKKSRGILTFLFSVIPLLNIIFLIICLKEQESILDLGLISLITQLGLYIIPITLAVSLFGFLFKQKSVDFVMSKPLSRKTIYTTNIIGGILLITIYILLNTFIFGIFNLLFSNLIIPIKLLIDYFILYLISYIFMYSIITLGISLCGNFISSIVILLIIVLMYPFLTLSNGFLTESYSIHHIKCEDKLCEPSNYECFNTDCREELKNNNYYHYLDKSIGSDYTTPVGFVRGLNNIYNTKVIIKMIILSIVYLGLGFIVFKNRKMEENEISFKSETKHFFVKTITFMPICLITYFLMSELDFIGVLIGVSLSLIYYVAYDLVTRKEIYKFRKSLLIFIISFGIYNGIYALVDTFESNHTLNVSDIKSITITKDGYTYDVTDKKYINKLISSTLSHNEKYYSYYDTIINTKNGTYNTTLTFNDLNLYQEVDNYINENIKKEVINYNYNKVDAVTYKNSIIPVTKNLKDILFKNIKKYNINTSEYIKVYFYRNHKYQIINIPLNISEDLYKYVISYSNQEAINKLKKKNGYKHFYINEACENNNCYFTELDKYMLDYVINNNFDSIINYLENNNKITYTNTYVDIECFVYNDNYSIRINEIDNFKNEFDKYKERLKNDTTYQNLLKEYEESKDSVTNEY